MSFPETQREEKSPPSWCSRIKLRVIVRFTSEFYHLQKKSSSMNSVQDRVTKNNFFSPLPKLYLFWGGGLKLKLNMGSALHSQIPDVTEKRPS